MLRVLFRQGLKSSRGGDENSAISEIALKCVTFSYVLYTKLRDLIAEG